MKFEDKLKRLEEIVSLLESGNTPLDDSVKLYSEGAALAKELTELLADAEQKITLMTADGSADNGKE